MTWRNGNLALWFGNIFSASSLVWDYLIKINHQGPYWHWVTDAKANYLWKIRNMDAEDHLAEQGGRHDHYYWAQICKEERGPNIAWKQFNYPQLYVCTFKNITLILSVFFKELEC